MNFALKRFFSSGYTFKKVGILAPLENRAILCVIGRDAYDVLQRACTNDVKKFQKDASRVSMATYFLDTNGRVIADAMLNKPQIFHQGKKVSQKNEIWLDCDKSQINEITSQIYKFSMRKEFDIGNISEDVRVWSLISPYFSSQESDCGKLWKGIEDTQEYEDDGDYMDFCYADPRTPALGARVIASAETERIEVFEEIDKVSTQEEYDKIRVLYGVGEGKEIASCLPFTANIDFLNSISLTKDEYLGQEPTSNFYTTDVVRKRIMPFIIRTPNVSIEDSVAYNVNPLSCDSNFRENLSDKILRNKEGENIGKIISNINNIGLAITSVNKLELKGDFEGFIDHHSCVITRNDWFMNKLKAYIESVRARDPNMQLE